jgi:nifR3 family TIM-barrel protein
MSFWQKLKKPIIVLAPMADVTDAAFRNVIAKYGKPDVTWTEFVSADGLCRATEEGKQKLLRDLLYSESERPIVAQLFGSNPEYMERAAALCRELGFDGIDINMGCPDKGVEKQGAGAAHIKNPKRAREVIAAAKQGAGSLPVSVKTRIGYNKNELEQWLPELLAEEPAVVTIHARTRKEMSNVPARWEHVKEAVEIRNRLGSKTLIFGNGDVTDVSDAKRKAAETGADGVMLGRAIFGNPFLFSEEKCPEGTEGLKLRLGVMIEHTKLFEKLLGDIKNFSIMKKHYKAYVTGFEGAAELRAKLMAANSAGEVERIVEEYLMRL